MNINRFFEIGFLGNFINGNTQNGSLQLALLILGGVLCIIVPYLLGSINFAIIISGKTYKQDIREFGSKNAGMTNMMRVYGKRAAGLTLLGDALKAVVAALFGYAMLGQLGAYIAGTACVIGHMFPIFFKFKGGKGVVTTAVTVLMCNPFVFLVLFLIFVIIVLGTKYISLGSVMCMLLYPFLLSAIDTWLNGGCPYVLFALLIAVLVIYKHKENIKRLREGKESKFSFKKSVKKDETQN